MENKSKRVIIVTGGSKGIGKSICSTFANSHTIIYFSYYSDIEAAKRTAASISKTGFEVFYKQVDVSIYEEVASFFKFIMDQSGRMDVLVNNAGTNIDGLLIRMNEKNWDRVIDVNLKGTFNCIKAVSRAMMRVNYGRIVNITSIVGLTGNPGQSNYSASKAGIIGLTKTAAREFASRNITVNAVAPGYINTAMTRKIGDNTADIIKQIPMGRAGNPDDISSVVSFLASKDASYITGQVINVNGGLYM